jgi:predicted dehydrogenase
LTPGGPPAQRARQPRIGVIGAGALGYHHIRLLRDLPQVSFAGFYESRPERSAAVASELGVAPAVSLDDLLDRVDALTVVVPTPAHAEVATAALARGIHVLIEKPLAATLAEAEALVAAARASGAMIQTGHVERFNRAIRAAAPYIDGPRFIESDRLAPFTARGSDVAVVLDLMIHDIDLVLTLIEDRVLDVAAVGVPLLTRSIDIANARLTFESGAVANITASRVSKERLRKIRIFQRSGYFSLDLADGSGEFYRLRRDVDMAALALSGRPLEIESFVERVALDAPAAEPLKLELESFAAAIRGEQPIAVSGEAGRDALAVALRIVREIEHSSVAMAAGETAGATLRPVERPMRR